MFEQSYLKKFGLVLRKIFLIGAVMLVSAIFAVAQDEKEVQFDASALPKTADSIEKFVPKGWEIEETKFGDLNNDGAADAAVKLIEKLPADADKENPPSRERVLLVLFKTNNGTFERTGVAENLLQCTGCGGAFYGVMPAPANVEIAKGVLIVNQDSGSRDVSEMTFRFRYDAKVGKFALIGFDFSDSDRLTGKTTKESTNYLTGLKITEVFQYDKKLDKDIKKSTRRTKVSGKTKYLEDVDYGELTEN